MYTPDSKDELAPIFELDCKKKTHQDTCYKVDYTYDTDLSIDELEQMLIKHMQELSDSDLVKFSRKQLANPFDCFRIDKNSFQEFGEFDPFTLSSSGGDDFKQELEDLLDLCNFLEKYGEIGSCILADYNSDLEDAATMLSECFEGEHESFKDFAQDYAESLYDIPDWLKNHIDWQSFADELEMDYTVIDRSKSKVLVFRNQ